jgi:uncharacterized RDD family membrane protein YckC
VLAVFIDLLLLAPAVQFGKEIYYLNIGRFDTQSPVESAAPLTEAERRQLTFTMWKQVADVGMIVFLMALPYYVLTESSALQGTLGKRLLGLRVTDLNGRRIRRGRAFGRYFARMLSATPWQFGFVMAGFTARKQALHDILAGTLVVRSQGDSEDPRFSQICASCANDLPQGAAFCNRCGVAVSAGRSALRGAGLGRRIAAALVDLVVLIPVLVILLRTLPPVSPTELRRMQPGSDRRLSKVDREDLYLMVHWKFSWLWAYFFFVSAPYLVLTESSRLQGSLGKHLLRMRVTDLGGRRIRLGRATGRYLARYLSGSLWLVGFIMPAFTSEKQALHDILTETRVVVAEKPDET